MARQVQTVLVSMLMHVVALFLLVVIPLLAMDGLPGIPSLTRYVPVEVVTPEMPAAPRPALASTQTPVDVAGPPTDAPTEIAPERPAQPPSLATLPGIEGGVSMPGIASRAVIENLNVAAPPVTPADPVRPGGQVKEPRRISFVAPIYPPVALAARVSGVVIIEAVIAVDGSVRDARVLRSIPLLDAAALAAVKQWRYTPTTLNGIPVAIVMTVSVRFEIGAT